MAMIVETRRPEGRPKRSPVRNHFIYDQESNEGVQSGMRKKIVELESKERILQI